MKHVTKRAGLGLVQVILIAALLAACTESPTEIDDTSGGSAASDLSAIGIETTGLEGIDLAALTRSVDLNGAAAALQAPPDAGKFGSSDRVVVHPGESIQDAVDAAPAGATVWVKPGTYVGPVEIHKPLRLIGWPGSAGEVVIVPPDGGAANGVSVMPENDGDELLGGVVLANMTARGFDRNGFFARYTDGLLMLRLTAVDNGSYGLYPVRSTNGIIAHSSATGSSDAGVYVGQSTNYLVAHNRAFRNVIGFELSNTRRIAAVHNIAFDNSTGILAVLLPPSNFITFLDASELIVSHNRVYDNNLPNFADGGFAESVPSGSGLLVVGYKEARVEHNRVTGNVFTGIGLGSTATFLALRGVPPDVIAAIPIDLDPRNVTIAFNHVVDNGTLPSPLPGLESADLLWDGSGSDVCWLKNFFETSVPEGLPSCEPGA